MGVKDKKSEQEVFNSEQEALLRDSFARYDDHLGIKNQTPEYLKFQFRQRLNRLSEKSSKVFFVRWQAFLGFFITAFSLGFLVSRLILMPASFTAKGFESHDGQQGYSINEETIRITQVVSNPKDHAHKLLDIALDAGLDVEVYKSEDRYSMYLKVLRVDSKEQEKIRSLIGVRHDAVGVVNILIYKK